MFTAACPACGAKVSLKASTSTAVVCGFCRSTLVRDAEALRRVGVQGELLEDHSRLQIGTGGRFDGRGFTVVGRIQLRYAEGAWNEWHVLFEDGRSAWLSEAGGQYAVTFDRGPLPGLPGFDAATPGSRLRLLDADFTVTDRRTAACTAAEGELPFPADSRWEARVADLRAGDRLVTLDWSAGEVPTLYAGRAVTLESLAPTLLRSTAEVIERAGALPGALQTLDCPSCGAPVRFVTQLATNVTCRQCKSELSARANGLVLEAERADRSERTTPLALGDAGDHLGERWTVIGILGRRADGDDEEWFEYLLYAPRSGFRWIVQVGAEFQWVEVLNVAPEVAGGTARVEGESFSRREAYDALNTWVVGSFNWRPKVGDRVKVVEFERRSGGVRTTLSEERTDSEITWSRAVDLPASVLAEAFGKPSMAAAGEAPASAPGAGMPGGARAGLGGLPVLFTVLLLLFVLPALVTGRFAATVPTVLIALVALWAPVRLLSGGDGD